MINPFPDVNFVWSSIGAKFQFDEWARETDKTIPADLSGPFRLNMLTSHQAQLRNWDGWYLFIPAEKFELWFVLVPNRRIS